MIGPEDEQPHAVGDDPRWSESYYFAFFGDELSGITRIGVRPNEGTIDALVVAFLPDGAIALGREVSPQHDNTADLAVGGVRYTCRDPLGAWDVRIATRLHRLDNPRMLLGEPGEATSIDLELDLSFAAATPAAEATLDGDRAAFARTATGHFEQSGAMTGTVDGRPFSGRGYRDKSWGVRDWSAPTMWRWFALPFGDDLVVNALVLGMGGHEVRGGWAWHDGAVRPVGEVELDTTTGPDGRAHTAVELGFTIEGAGRLTARGEVLTIAPLPLHADGRTTLVNEGLTRWTLQDGRTTLGIAEYLHQVTGDPAEEAIARAAQLIA